MESANGASRLLPKPRNIPRGSQFKNTILVHQAGRNASLARPFFYLDNSKTASHDPSKAGQRAVFLLTYVRSVRGRVRQLAE